MESVHSVLSCWILPIPLWIFIIVVDRVYWRCNGWAGHMDSVIMYHPCSDFWQNSWYCADSPYGMDARRYLMIYLWPKMFDVTFFMTMMMVVIDEMANICSCHVPKDVLIIHWWCHIPPAARRSCWNENKDNIQSRDTSIPLPHEISQTRHTRQPAWNRLSSICNHDDWKFRWQTIHTQPQSASNICRAIQMPCRRRWGRWNDEKSSNMTHTPWYLSKNLTELQIRDYTMPDMHTGMGYRWICMAENSKVWTKPIFVLYWR